MDNQNPQDQTPVISQQTPNNHRIIVVIILFVVAIAAIVVGWYQMRNIPAGAAPRRSKFDSLPRTVSPSPVVSEAPADDEVIVDDIVIQDIDADLDKLDAELDQL